MLDALEFVRRWWAWAAAGVGGLVLLVLVLWTRRTPEVLVVKANEELAASRVKAEADARAQVEENRARQTLELTTREVVRQNAEVIRQLDTEQRTRANTLLRDPEALNQYLLDLGRQLHQ